MKALRLPSRGTQNEGLVACFRRGMNSKHTPVHRPGLGSLSLDKALKDGATAVASRELWPHGDVTPVRSMPTIGGLKTEREGEQSLRNGL
jgi:hypothetical protein